MTQKTKVSPLEDHIGYWIRCLSNFVHESFAQRIKHYDISVEQWVVLRTLFDHENTTLQEAAVLIGVDNSSLSRMIERLVKKNMVTRITPENNRRAVILNLTPQAKELVPILAQEADQNDQAFFQVIEPFQSRAIARNF